MAAEDQRLGQLLRAIRREMNLTQAKLASEARIPREDIIAVEAGRASEIELARLRRLFGAVDARLKVTVWWRGAAADQLLDARHASLSERGIQVLASLSWLVLSEVTFSEFGERGSIDILGGHVQTRSVVVGEVKASIGSIEETNRRLDVKERLAPKIARDRFGWAPRSVSRVLIVPEDSTIRRILERHHQTMEAVYPSRGREFRKWLGRPEGRISAIWFLSEVADSRHRSGAATHPKRDDVVRSRREGTVGGRTGSQLEVVSRFRDR